MFSASVDPCTRKLYEDVASNNKQAYRKQWAQSRDFAFGEAQGEKSKGSDEGCQTMQGCKDEEGKACNAAAECEGGIFTSLYVFDRDTVTIAITHPNIHGNTNIEGGEANKTKEAPKKEPEGK